MEVLRSSLGYNTSSLLKLGLLIYFLVHDTNTELTCFPWLQRGKKKTCGEAEEETTGDSLLKTNKSNNSFNLLITFDQTFCFLFFLFLFFSQKNASSWGLFCCRSQSTLESWLYMYSQAKISCLQKIPRSFKIHFPERQRWKINIPRVGRVSRPGMIDISGFSPGLQLCWSRSRTRSLKSSVFRNENKNEINRLFTFDLERWWQVIIYHKK